MFAILEIADLGKLPVIIMDDTTHIFSILLAPGIRSAEPL